MKNQINPELEPVHLWHDIARNGFATRAMNVPGGVLIAHQAMGIVFVQGLVVAKRWQVMHVEAYEGMEVETHDAWTCEIGLASCVSNAMVLDHACDALLKGIDPKPKRSWEPDESCEQKIRKLLVSWVSADGPLPSLKAAGVDV